MWTGPVSNGLVCGDSKQPISKAVRPGFPDSVTTKPWSPKDSAATVHPGATVWPTANGPMTLSHCAVGVARGGSVGLGKAVGTSVAVAVYCATTDTAVAAIAASARFAS